jgi:drug/metabolite transporter (DMT)-like permease
VDAALLAVALMWASTFALFKLAWRDVDPVAFTGIRFAAMFVFAVALVAVARDRVRPRRRDLPVLVASGLTGYFLYQMGFVLGLDRTTALASAILISTHPIFAVMFAWVAGRERPTGVEVLGVALGFLGVAVFLRAWDAFAAARPGDLLSLGAAAAFGAYGVINRPLTQRYPSRELMAYTLSLGGVLIALVSLPAMVRQDWTAVSGPAWIILAYAIVGPVYLAYVLWNWAISKRGIPRTVVYGFLIPVLGGGLAVLTLGEPVRWENVAGALLVVAGLVVTRLGGGRRATSLQTRPLAAVQDVGPAGSVGRYLGPKGGPMGDQDNREAVREYWAGFESGDVDRVMRAFDTYVADDFVQEWPQSGERIRGKANARAINENYPGVPSAKLRDVRGSGDLWVGEMTLDYGRGPVHSVSILEFRDGKLVKETDYFADPFEAPEWRSQWVERM